MKVNKTHMILLLSFWQTTWGIDPNVILHKAGFCIFKTFQLWMLTREVKKWCKEKEKKKIAFTLGAAAVGTLDGNSASDWFTCIKNGSFPKKPTFTKSFAIKQIKQNPCHTARDFGNALSQGIEKAFILLVTVKSYEKLITQGWLKRSCWLGYHGLKFMFS